MDTADLFETSLEESVDVEEEEFTPAEVLSKLEVQNALKHENYFSKTRKTFQIVMDTNIYLFYHLKIMPAWCKVEVEMPSKDGWSGSV